MPSPPLIFDPSRRRALRHRMARLQNSADAPRYLMQEMVDDTIERLAFLRLQPGRALVVGDVHGHLSDELRKQGCDTVQRDPVLGPSPLDEEKPFGKREFDLVVSLAVLDTVNDLPGALIHIHNALTEGGLAICSFPGAGSLAKLRQIMLAADGEHPAARMHPLVDARAGAQLLQRAGFADPVTDSHTLKVRYSSLQTMVHDLRAMALTNVLADRPPPLSKRALALAESKFAELADADGKLHERFEILTLTGRHR